jgi:hypothetical protein
MKVNQQVSDAVMEEISREIRALAAFSIQL